MARNDDETMKAAELFLSDPQHTVGASVPVSFNPFAVLDGASLREVGLDKCGRLVAITPSYGDQPGTIEIIQDPRGAEGMRDIRGNPMPTPDDISAPQWSAEQLDKIAGHGSAVPPDLNGLPPLQTAGDVDDVKRATKFCAMAGIGAEKWVRILAAEFRSVRLITLQQYHRDNVAASPAPK